MTPEQERRMSIGRRRHHSPEEGGERFGEDRFEGQYEKDPWRPEWRADPRRATPDYRGQRPAGTGGYYGVGSGSLEPDWHPAERRYPPGPKGYQRSDERLREDISERLMEARYIDSSDVTVAVSGAKVVLEGTVPQRRMKHAIEDLVDACPGVLDIDNRIRVRRE
jgi:BON domain